jgi:hypothetical protein
MAEDPFTEGLSAGGRDSGSKRSRTPTFIVAWVLGVAAFVAEPGGDLKTKVMPVHRWRLRLTDANPASATHSQLGILAPLPDDVLLKN